MGLYKTLCDSGLTAECIRNLIGVHTRDSLKMTGRMGDNYNLMTDITHMLNLPERCWVEYMYHIEGESLTPHAFRMGMTRAVALRNC